MLFTISRADVRTGAMACSCGWRTDRNPGGYYAALRRKYQHIHEHQDHGDHFFAE